VTLLQDVILQGHAMSHGACNARIGMCNDLIASAMSCSELQ
jgi:hypothetical protein